MVGQTPTARQVAFERALVAQFIVMNKLGFRHSIVPVVATVITLLPAGIAVANSLPADEDPLVFDCEILDPRVAVPIADQPGMCNLDRSSLARLNGVTFPDDAATRAGAGAAQAPDGALGQDARKAGTWLSALFSLTALGGTAYSFLRTRRNAV